MLFEIWLALHFPVMASGNFDFHVGYPHNVGFVLYSRPKPELKYHVLGRDGATAHIAKIRSAKNGPGCDGREDLPVWALDGTPREIREFAIVIGTTSAERFAAVRSKNRKLKTKINQEKQSQNCTIAVEEKGSKKKLFSVTQAISFGRCDPVGQADANRDGSADVFLLNLGDYHGTALVIEKEGKWKLQKGVDPGPC